jgi:hypothetical protein
MLHEYFLLGDGGLACYYAPVDPGLVMVSPLSKGTPVSRSCLWAFPECPVRIQVHYHFIDRLQKEVLDAASADREVGGLLIGNELSPGGEVEICDHFSLPPSSESTKNFVICSDSLTQAVQSKRAPDRRVIGFYRTHLDQRIELRAEDQECIRLKFNNPSNVFLVLRPGDRRSSAKFFFWQDGAVVGGLTFPFSSTELKTPTWTTVVGGTPKETRLDSLIRRARVLAERVDAGMKAGLASTHLRIGTLAAAVILIAIAGGLRLYHSRSETSPTLGLRAERALLGIEVKWNPATPEIATAKDADLVVWDGSSPPLFVRLTSAQLLAGRTFVASANDRVEVRLDIIGTAGRARTESIVSVAEAPGLVPPSAPAQGTKEEAKEATLPPPVSKPNTSLAALSKRPEAPPAKGDATAALTQRFHEFTPPVKPAPVGAEEPSPVAFQAAVPIRETRPEIPSDLRTLIQSDNVVDVQVRISASGKVTAARLGALKGPVADALGKTALNAALGWQFRPATQNGEAVPSDKILEFLFRPSTH